MGLTDRWEGSVYYLVHRDCDAEREEWADGLICFDAPDNIPKSFQLIVLGAGGGPVPVNGCNEVPEDGFNIFMLVVMPTGPSDEYRRIGVAFRCVPVDCGYPQSLRDKRRIVLI